MVGSPFEIQQLEPKRIFGFHENTQMPNFRHLYYFWIVAKQGGFARAAEHLGMAVQTISV